MRTSDVDILIVPGHGGSGPDHWQSRWERQLSTARRVHQPNWDAPDLAAWAERIVATAEGATRPVVVVAHGLGVHAVARAADALEGRDRRPPSPHRRAPDLEDASRPPDANLAGLRRADAAPAPSRALVVASRTDPWCELRPPQRRRSPRPGARPSRRRRANGRTRSNSGALGPNGPWPEGHDALRRFLKKDALRRRHTLGRLQQEAYHTTSKRPTVLGEVEVEARARRRVSGRAGPSPYLAASVRMATTWHRRSPTRRL